jgi:membrane-bound lytic murein transglycosylase B
VVLIVFAVCVSVAFVLWVRQQTGAGAPDAFAPPPQARAELEVLSSGMTTAVNITRSSDAGWLASAAGQTGIPERALRAYVAAAAAADGSMSGCGIGWNTLAAVGFVETAHGAYGGGSLTDAGQVSRPIIGPVLDGAGFAAIADTDSGVLDGDARWDRAVGPMQFIPSTWRLVARDGNGDGTADPFNIDDAALSAATYLCANGRDLTTADGWTDAIYAYNQSDAYIRQVRDRATEYAVTAGSTG